MTIGDYFMTTVNVAKLKAELSKYIKLAEAGEEVIITDHKVPKVKLVVIDEKPKLQVTEPTRPFSDLKPLKLSKSMTEVDVVALIREDRDNR